MQLVFYRFQSRRLYIAGVHGRRQVYGEDQRRAVFQKVRSILFPSGAGSGNRTQHQQGTDQMHRTQPVLILRRDQQVRQQMFGNVAAQAPLQILAASPEQRQQGGEGQQQQPEWAQEVEVAEVDIHLRPPAVDGQRSGADAAARTGDRARAVRLQRQAATRTDPVWVDDLGF
ncbi:hypothetical protein D3C72_836400 [compost metagenome]